MPPFD